MEVSPYPSHALMHSRAFEDLILCIVQENRPSGILVLWRESSPVQIFFTNDGASDQGSRRGHHEI